MKENELNDIRDLIEVLSGLKNNIKNVADSLNRLEKNEIDSIKAMFELRSNVSGQLKDVENKVAGIEKPLINLDRSVTKIVEKLAEKLPEFKSIVTEITDILDKKLEKFSSSKGSVKISDECTDCFIFKDKQKTIKILMYALAFIVLALLLVLGLNLFKVVKLNIPTIGCVLKMAIWRIV